MTTAANIMEKSRNRYRIVLTLTWVLLPACVSSTVSLKTKTLNSLWCKAEWGIFVLICYHLYMA